MCVCVLLSTLRHFCLSVGSAAHVVAAGCSLFGAAAGVDGVDCDAESVEESSAGAAEAFSAVELSRLGAQLESGTCNSAHFGPSNNITVTVP